MKNGSSIGFNTFQLTSPRGDELKMARVLVRIYHFNSCLREETNVYDKFMYDLRQLFQLTSPQGDELQILVLGTYSSYFNSHPSKETNVKHRATGYSEINFNSRLREGTNTFFQVFFKRTFSITTHIPTKRRTFLIV